MIKIISWLALNLVSVLGIIQAVIKLVKEICTAVVNLLFPLFPDNGKFEKAVLKVRAIVEIADTWVEKIKQFLLPK
uniref:Uncharacterized protein n=1 Tax=viral metagenome TaxID=1070528 RepID=A0A6H1ZF47_9ZZZZ